MSNNKNRRGLRERLQNADWIDVVIKIVVFTLLPLAILFALLGAIAIIGAMVKDEGTNNDQISITEELDSAQDIYWQTSSWPERSFVKVLPVKYPDSNDYIIEYADSIGYDQKYHDLIIGESERHLASEFYDLVIIEDPNAEYAEIGKLNDGETTTKYVITIPVGGYDAKNVIPKEYEEE